MITIFVAAVKAANPIVPGANCGFEVTVAAYISLSPAESNARLTACNGRTRYVIVTCSDTIFHRIGMRSRKVIAWIIGATLNSIGLLCRINVILPIVVWTWESGS